MLFQTSAYKRINFRFRNHCFFFEPGIAELTQRERENRCQSLKTIPRVKNTEAKQPQLVDPLLLPNPPTRQATGPQPAAPIRQTRNQPARPCLHPRYRSRHRRAPRLHGRSRRRRAPRLPVPHRVWPPLARTDVESRCAVPRRQPARPCFHPRRHPQLVWVLLRNNVPGVVRGRTIGDLGRRRRCRNVHHRRATGPLPQPTRPSWIMEPQLHVCLNSGSTTVSGVDSGVF